MRKDTAAKFFRHFGTLLGSGIPLCRALKACSEYTYLSDQKDSILRLIDQIVAGDSFGQALEEMKLPAACIEMINWSQKQGTLDHMLPRVADLLDHMAADIDEEFNIFASLDDRTIQQVLRGIDMDQLAQALIKAPVSISEAFRRNMSRRAVSLLEDMMKSQKDLAGEAINGSRCLILSVLDGVIKAAGGPADITGDQETSEESGQSADSEHETTDENAVLMVNKILLEAHRANASDIHVVPTMEGFLVRFRVGGVLRNNQLLPRDQYISLVSRIKYISALDIAERRLPQDGRIKIRIEGSEMDIRISVVPSALGEKVTMRLVRSERALIGLEKIMMTPEEMKELREILSRNWGLIIVTGGYGSGKTTTCLSMLKDYADRMNNVVTVEDPIEYIIDGATQMQVRPDIGLTFEKTLTTAMRTDPDVIFVAEIRDPETFRLAVQAAHTGHVVVVQMYSRNIPDLIKSLLSIEGVDRTMLSSTISGIVSQVLLRRLCQCSAEATEESGLSFKGLSPEQAKKFKALAKSSKKVPLRRAAGCEKCLDSGYMGVFPVYQILRPGHDFKEALAAGDARKAISEVKGSLLDGAAEKYLQGLTSLEELERVFSGL